MGAMSDSTKVNASNPAASGQPQAVAGLQQSDALGEFGTALTRYHVGDVMGFIGLVLSVLTLLAARSAKRAARAALARRDVLEIAALLSDIGVKLRDVRTVLAADEWAGLSERIDSAVHVLNRLDATAAWEEETKLAETVRGSLRNIQKATSGIKDAQKHGKLRRTHDEVLIGMLDAVEIAHVKRLKHDSLS